MRRLLLALLIGFFLASLPAVAEAGHGRWHRGHWHRHGGWGHRWGGFYGGWGGVSVSVGWPAYGYSYFPAYGYPAYGYGGYWPAYNWAPAYGGCYGYSGASLGVYPAYGVRYVPRSNYVEYFADSSYEPAELAFGPLAVKQFLGLDRNFAMSELQAPVQPPPAAKIVRLKVRTSNADARRRADRYIAQGDELFEKQNWHSALQKYKLAGQLAPDVAECSWRQGHALIAVNQFDQAAAAFRRALLISDDTTRGGFQLDELYADGVAAKNSHLEALASEALASTISSDPYFLIGVTLHYGGEPERARKYFERAAAMSAEDGKLVESFLAPKPGPGLPSLTLPVKADEMEI
jgi:tetratricopeptide (TPR) repeat protein